MLRALMTIWLSGLILMVAGCSAAAAPAGPAASPSLASLTPWQADLLDQADQTLIGDCMRRHGFQYRAYPAHNFLDQLFPYVFDNAAWSRRYGYGTGNALSPSGAADPNARYVRTLTQARRVAYGLTLSGSGPGLQIRVPGGGGIIGESSTGCSAWADGRLYGGFAPWFYANTLAFLAQPMLTRDVEGNHAYQRAAAQWSACMRSRGYHYASPARLHDTRATRDRHRTPIQTAVAEATCATRTPLAAIARHLNTVYTKRLPRRFQSAIRNELRLEHSALLRAHHIVGSDAGQPHHTL